MASISLPGPSTRYDTDSVIAMLEGDDSSGF